MLDAADHDLVIDDLATVSDSLTRSKLEILSTLGDASTPITRPAHPAGLPADAEAHPRRASRRGHRVHRDRHRRGPTARRGSGADVDRLPRQADSRFAVRRSRCGGAQRRRPGGGPGNGRDGARQLCRGVDQTRPHRLHRHQQVVCAANRAEPGRRLQQRSARRPGRQAGGAGQARPLPHTRCGRRRGLAGDRRGGGQRVATPTVVRATSSRRSPTCWPPRRPRRPCASGCLPACGGSTLPKAVRPRRPRAYSNVHECCGVRGSGRGFGRCPGGRGRGGHRARIRGGVGRYAVLGALDGLGAFLGVDGIIRRPVDVRCRDRAEPEPRAGIEHHIAVVGVDNLSNPARCRGEYRWRSDQFDDVR